MKYRFALVALLAFALAACDETTGTLGISADNDKVSNSTANFTITSKSLLLDKGIIANNSYCYLGRVTDPETGSVVEADFATQFETFENYGFPDKDLMVDSRDTNNIKYGVPVCDSCDIRLFFDSYYGEKSNPMKLQVYEMSHDAGKIMEEDSVYYTSIDLTQFLDEDAKPISSRMFTVSDFQVSEEEREASDYNKNIHISMPASLGQRIMDKFYEDKKNFKDSYHFIRNVLPGLYFRCNDGNGTMVKVFVGTLNVYFNYYDSKGDSVCAAMSRFAATPEVIQSTSFNNSSLSELASINDYTYLKTPAGIATELTLPIDEIFSGEHAADSISKASITLTRYNKSQEGEQLETPSEILLVRKSEMYSFFENHEVSNSRTNYTSAFSSTYNTYTFSNIGRLLSYCKHEKIEAVRQRLAEKGHTDFTDAQFAEEEKLWMAENPDWDKVVLIPVVSTTTTQSTSYGTVTSQVAVNHDMGLNSIRLVGGKTPLQMQVVYSRFK